MGNPTAATPVETPTDSPVPQPVNPDAKKVPQRGKRKRVLGDGEGDYCIFELVGAGSELPKGSLIPIPGVPRFEETRDAMKWIQTESKDLLHGKQVMIFRACEILSLVVEAKPVLTIQAKAKKTVTDPTQESPAKPVDTPSNG
jgi:hypothetical protein